jgi:hypothetical protein
MNSKLLGQAVDRLCYTDNSQWELRDDYWVLKQSIPVRLVVSASSDSITAMVVDGQFFMLGWWHSRRLSAKFRGCRAQKLDEKLRLVLDKVCCGG